MSTTLCIINSEYWIRVNLALEFCIKSVLIDILHNADNDPSYNGLPTNPTQLYSEMLQYQNDKKHDLHKVLNKNQWYILCPENQQTHSKNFDITILVAVIRSVIGLEPLGGWKTKALQPNDNSKGAVIFLCRNLRNEVKHCSVDDIKDLSQFQTYWIRIENILLGLNFKDMASFNSLEVCSLDKYLDTIVDMVNNLEQEVKILRDQASDNSVSINNIHGTIDVIQSTITQISSTKADKSDVEQALSLKADKKDLEKVLEKLNASKTNLLQEPIPNIAMKIETTQPVSRFGCYNHFVKWDNQAVGGRFFECDVKVDESPYSDAYVVAHDGDTGTFSRGLIFRLGVTPEVNDDVIAYFDKRGSAFSGKVTAKRPGGWFVEYNDGDKEWIWDEWVHKKVSF